MPNAHLVITIKDCRVEYTKGTGAGGQKRNKTSSAVRITHEPSGAVGYSEATRSQAQNKQDAFAKMARSPQMQSWLRLEMARREGTLLQAEEAAERQMAPKLLRVEGKRDGRWVELGDEDAA